MYSSLLFAVVPTVQSYTIRNAIRMPTNVVAIFGGHHIDKIVIKLIKCNRINTWVTHMSNLLHVICDLLEQTFKVHHCGHSIIYNLFKIISLNIAMIP